MKTVLIVTWACFIYLAAYLFNRQHDLTGGTWKHLQVITEQPHGYNSDYNLILRQYIQDTLKSYQQLAYEQGVSLIVENDESNLKWGNHWHESNNVVARLLSNVSHESLLISCHFDSTTLSPGATDDGIAISVMLQVIPDLIQSNLKHDIIFLFNNAEEIGLLGAAAFLLHPWSKDVKAFINLEGTGVSQSTQSAIFRTNSYQLTQAYEASVPFPHALVLFQDIFKFVHADTDYRPFADLGKLPGLDIAFYNDRRLTHTPLDDINHTSLVSMETSRRNLLAVVKHIGNASWAFESSEDPFESSFCYYDILGNRMVLYSHTIQNMLLIGLLALAIILSAVHAYGEYTKLKSWVRFCRLHVQPIFYAILAIFLSNLVALGGVYLLSSLKHSINPMSSYGLPRTNFWWIAWLTLLLFTITQNQFLNLCRKYDLMPFPESPYVMLDDEEETESPAPPFEHWLHIGLLWYWSAWVLIALIVSFVSNVHGLFFILYWFVFCGFSTLVAIVGNHFMLNWWKDNFTGDSTPEWKAKALSLYREHSWMAIFLVSTLVPAILTWDLTDIVLRSLPSLLREKFPEQLNDLAFGLLSCLMFVNFIPLLHICDRRKMVIFLFVGFLVLFMVSCLRSPFSADYPQLFYYDEVWNPKEKTSNLTVQFQWTREQSKYVQPLKQCLGSEAHCSDSECILPSIKSNPKLSNVGGEITVLKKNRLKDSLEIHGNLTGTVSSRICQLLVDSSTEPLVWLDVNHLDQWKSINETKALIEPSKKAVLLRRSLETDRMATQFKIKFETNSTIDVKLKWICHYDQTVYSPVYHRLKDCLPDYVVPVDGRLGEMQIIHFLDLIKV